MITKNKNVLSAIRNKIPPFAQLLLLFSFSISRSPLFILVALIPKYLPVIIITSHFTWKLDENTKNNFYISYNLRKAQLVNILPQLTMTRFYFIGIILFLFEFVFFAYLFHYYFIIKKKQSGKIILHWYPKIMFYLNTIFSQYIVEYYSFTLLLFLKKKLIMPTNSIYKDYAKVPIITSDDNYNIIIVGILTVIQCCFLILINVFTFYSLVIINSSYRTSIPTLRFTHMYRFYFFVFFTDLSCIEYYEIFLTDNGRFKFNCFTFTLLFLVLFLDIITNVRTYEENNYFYFLIRFLNNYNLVSIIFEFISTMKDFQFTVKETYIFTFFKMFLTISTLYLLIFFRSQFMLNLSKAYLFDTLEQNKLTQVLECFNYLLDELIEIKTQKNNANEVINVIILHQKKCTNDLCKCKEIQPIPICGIEDNKEFTNKLIRGFGFLMETCFANGTSYNHISYSLFLAEYFSHIKDNLIISYSLLQSCLTLNVLKMNFIQAFELCNYINFYNQKFKEKFKNSTSSMKFYRIFDNIFERMEFNRNIIEYCNTFENLIDTKMSFENSLKFITDPDTNEIISIDSIFLTRDVILDVIKKLTNMSKISKRVKKNLIKYSNERKGAEFYYLTFLFFTMFSNRIPSNIVKTFDKISAGAGSFKGLSQEDMTDKFNKVIDKYISSESAMNQIIIKFSKGIKIKYCSSNFCNQLGFIQSQLLGEDFANIFPKSLRRSHTRAMLHYIMVGQNYFLKKSTYIFDSSEHSMPCDIRGGALPHFGKSLMMICQIMIKKNKTWSFILDNNYNGLSISREIEENYFFNLNLLRKVDMEIIDIFDINTNIMKNKFKDTLDVIEKVKDELEFNDVEQYSKNLFNLNANGELDLSDKGFIPNKKSLEISNSNNDLCDTSILFGKKMETIEFVRNKPILIQNIIKALNKLSDSVTRDENINQLLQLLIKVKNDVEGNNENNENNEFINIDGVKIEKSATLQNAMFDPEYEQEKKISNATLQILFKGAIKKLYDIPIYIFRFRDILDNEEGYKADNHNEENKENENDNNKEIATIIQQKTSQKNFFNNNTQGGTMGNFFGGTVGTMGTVQKNYFKGMNTMFSTQSSIASVDNRINNMAILNQAAKFGKKSSQYKKAVLEILSNKTAVKKLELSSILLMIICFCLSIFNVAYQLIRVNRVQTIISFYIQISNLQDKISYLQSALLTEMFEFGDYSQMYITDEQMFNYLKLSIDSLKESISSFYKEMVKYDQKIGKNTMGRIYGDFMKIVKTWENVTYESDIFKELYYAIYLTNNAVKEDSPSNIMKDVDVYFFNVYRKNMKMEVYSSFMKVVFFIVNNFEDTFKPILQNLFDEVGNNGVNFLRFSEKLMVVFEILWLCTNLAFFVFALLLFSKFNRKIFKLIISMFLDAGKNEKGTFKNKPENFYMKQKIRLFILLVHNFTMENKLAFQNFRENFIKGNINNTSLLQFDENGLPITKNPIIELSPSSKNTNTTNITNSQSVTNQNLINSKPLVSILNKDDKKNLKNKKEVAINEKHSMSNKEAAISNVKLLKLLNQQKITISYLMMIVVGIFAVASFVIFYLHINNTLTYNKQSTILINAFNNFIVYFNSLPQIMSSLRKLILTQSEVTEDLLTYSVDISNYEKQISLITSSTDFKIFDKIKYFWKQVNLEMNDPSIDTEYLCTAYSLCQSFLLRDNGYCLEGIILGYELIAQKYSQIIGDYENLLINGKGYVTKANIKEYIITEVFDRVQENIEFVFSKIQDQFYISFLQDYKTIRNILSKKTVLLNIVFFLFELVIIIVMLCFIELYIKGKEYLVKDGSTLFNTAFFKEPVPTI